MPMRGQFEISGYVVDAKSDKPLAFVNIGIINKNTGTVSDIAGRFTFIATSSDLQDSIRFSMIGYTEYTLDIKSYMAQHGAESRIALLPMTEQLPSIVISGKRLREQLIGSTSNSKIFTCGFASDNLGNEVGQLIKIKNENNILKKIHIHIASVTHDTIRFRINLYEYDNDRPGRNLLNNNIIFSVVDPKDGWMTIDVQKYNIVLGRHTIVALEWIEDFGAGEIRFSYRPLGPPLFYRKASQGNWEREKRGSISMAVTVIN